MKERRCLNGIRPVSVGLVYGSTCEESRAVLRDRVAVIFSQLMANYYLFIEVGLIEGRLYGEKKRKCST
jgi:hypothetical protein